MARYVCPASSASAFSRTVPLGTTYSQRPIRKIPSDECLRIGLCEYVVPNGTVREKAEALAHEIARFPQVCVRADRRSAIRSHGLPVREALIQEWYNGREALRKDGIAGAGRFKDGLGRHGDFDRIR